MSDALHDFVHHSVPNATGGEDLFDPHGIHIGQTSANIMGGHDLYNDHGSCVGHTVDNVHGGHDVINAEGIRQASTIHTGHETLVQDGEGRLLGTIEQLGDKLAFMDVTGHYATWSHNIFGGLTADPLTHMARINFPSLLL